MTPALARAVAGSGSLAGYSNAEIAATLFISVKTVEANAVRS